MTPWQLDLQQHRTVPILPRHARKHFRL
jgi:hypothetical protein